MILPVQLGKDSYDIVVERGCLARAGEYLDLARKVLIVTDDGVPPVYAQTIAACCASPTIVTVPAGEGSKSFATLETLCRTMLDHGFTRTDCVAAVGGGVVGDLAGFAAACYMRGVAFYNLPTTLLAQVDSSVGGKVAVNLDDIKNCVGAFYQPKRVLIDPDVLATLSPRQLAAGMAEAVKMSLTGDSELFTLFEAEDPLQKLETVITRSLTYKRWVVEQDEKEQSLRRVLNFGHTIGHAIESRYGLHAYLHGECVAMGMLPMCEPSVRERLIPVLQKLNLPAALPNCPLDELLAAVVHDKKADGDKITVTYVPRVGSFELRRIPVTELKTYWERSRTK